MAGEKKVVSEEDKTKKREALFNVAAGIAAVLVSALLILAFSKPAQWYAQNATERSHNYAREAEQQIAARCNVRAQSDPVNCRSKAIEAAREYQRKEQDLAAQQITALWTWIMGAAAVVGVLLSAFGVFLVWRTFHATRETNEIARETAYRQLRAYLSADDATLEIWWDGEWHNAKLVAAVVNNGLTPAIITDERFFVKIIGGEMGVGGGGGGESRDLTEIVAPRSVHTFANEIGLCTNPTEKVRYRVGYLFTYTDYLGHPWTELIWWRSDRVHVTATRKQLKLILSRHGSGPDNDLKWSEMEVAEWQALANQINNADQAKEA